MCLPVYTCCADLLLLYSRHRQADRWQPHWHQNRDHRTANHFNETAGSNCCVVINRWQIFSPLLNHLSSSWLTYCFKLRCVNKLFMTQVYRCVWLAYFRILVQIITWKDREWNECEGLTSSSLNQDRLWAVRMNQYSLAPPFMMPMLLTISQPLRMTCTTVKGKKLKWLDWQQQWHWQENKKQIYTMRADFLVRIGAKIGESWQWRDKNLQVRHLWNIWCSNHGAITK